MSDGPYEQSGMSDRPMCDRPVSDHPIIGMPTKIVEINEIIDMKR